MEDDEVFDFNHNAVTFKFPDRKKEFVNMLVKDFIHHKAYGNRRPSSGTAVTLRRVSDELEDSNKAFFDDVCERLEIQDTDVETKFKVVTEDVLRDKVSWGRLVSLFVFSGKIAEWFARRQSSQKIDELCDWLTESICRQQGWIDENGGWAAFEEQFEEISPFTASLLKKGLAIATTIGIAAVFVSKVKP